MCAFVKRSMLASLPPRLCGVPLHRPLVAHARTTVSGPVGVNVMHSWQMCLIKSEAMHQRTNSRETVYENQEKVNSYVERNCG